MERILCHCLVVSESEVEAVIQAGATTLAQVSAACEAGTGCHGCHEAIRVMLQEAATRDPRRLLGQTRLFSDE